MNNATTGIPVLTSWADLVLILLFGIPVAIQLWRILFVKPKLRILFEPEQNRNYYTPQFTIGFLERQDTDGRGGTLTTRVPIVRQFMKVVVKNEGRARAKRCKASLRLLDCPEDSRPPSKEPKTLCWESQEIYQDVAAKGGEEPLYVVLSDSRMETGEIPEKENIFALIATPETIKMVPPGWLRAQDGFGVGDFRFRLTVTTEDGHSASGQFRVHVTKDWKALSMEAETHE